MKNRLPGIARILALGLGLAGPVWAGSGFTRGGESTRLEGQGEVKCLDGRGVLRPADQDCRQNGWDYALQTERGPVWRFLRDDPRAGILTDDRVRRQRLHVIAEDRGGPVEIITVHVIRDGTHYLPHYYCEVCAITAYAPGPCWCCQEPFEFRERALQEERPLSERSHNGVPPH